MSERILADRVLLSGRLPNLGNIAIMVAVILFGAFVVTQIGRKVMGKGQDNNG
jgi:hypothetical protein